MIETSSYIVEHPGPWTPGQIALRFEKEPFLGPPERRAEIVANFQARQAEAAAIRRKLFNGKLARVREVAATAHNGGLAMTLQETDYVTFLSTNLLHPENFAPAEQANGLGCSAVLITSDARLVLGHRSQQVFYNRGKLHTIGGVIEWSRTPESGQADGGWLTDQLLKEFYEELALDPEEVKGIRFLALVRDRVVGQPELVCEARLRLSFAALRSQWQREGDVEHEQLWHCPDSPEAVIDALMRAPDRFSPIAQAALLAYLSVQFGPDALAPLMKK